MRKNLLSVAALVAILFSAVAAHAADTLVYSMEGAPPPSGFAANGGGVTVTQSTIGATEGANSMKMAVVTGATFVGALTTNVPAAIGNPPGADHVTFDLTIGPNDPFAGAFSLVGITIFGFNAGAGGGLQSQFAPFIHTDGLAPGTYTETIPLTGATNQVDFSTNQTFNQIFGSGANQQVVTGFQFFLNKSNDAPSTVYIDNVRIGSVPEPASCALLGLGAIGLVAVARRRFR